jgi:RNA polymerase sigma-70 factor (ECF subfamily)
VQNVEGWLFRIAHNTAMDFLPRRTREQAVFAAEDVEAQIDTQAEADRRHVATAALRTFMRLPPAQRSTVILADVMSATVPAVKAALHRGRTRLRELSQEPDDPAPPPRLSAAEQALLAAYAARFNARDFDGVRETLAQDVRLDLVARRKPMQARGGEHFTNYAKTHGLHVTPMNVEGRPALWVHAEGDEGPGAQGYVVVLEWRDGKVSGIRDFRYARWATEDHLPAST